MFTDLQCHGYGAFSNLNYIKMFVFSSAWKKIKLAKTKFKFNKNNR